jgi:hypothetical protein
MREDLNETATPFSVEHCHQAGHLSCTCFEAKAWAPSALQFSPYIRGPHPAGMALNEAIFRSKLDQLNPSQQSIEGTSAWCLFHRQDARRVAEVWEDYFSHADQAKRLAMVYLANDIVQNG